MTRRVVITAVGLASPFGVGRRPFMEGLASGGSALVPLDGLLGAVPPGRGAELDLPVKEYRHWFDTRLLRLSTMTRQTTLGCVACGDLLNEAGLEAGGEHPDKGCYLGSFIVPPSFTKQARAVRFLSHRPAGEDTGWVLDDDQLALAMKKASAFDFLRALPNMPSSHLSIQTGYQGPTCTYLGSDSSGMQAIIMAVGAIRSGLADAMVAGGAFCPFQEVHLAWQAQRGLWTDGDVRPYCEGATGTLPGEGAALVYLEERGSALARGATILGEVTGIGQTVGTAGFDDVEVRADALRAAMPSGAPDWVAPTGLGHRQLDGLEAEALDAAFDLSATAAVTAVPSVGFTGPAAGPMNLVAGILAARGDFAPHRAPADKPLGQVGAALGRTGPTGEGTTLLGSACSLDGVHAAIAVRISG